MFKDFCSFGMFCACDFSDRKFSFTRSSLGFPLTLEICNFFYNDFSLG